MPMATNVIRIKIRLSVIICIFVVNYDNINSCKDKRIMLILKVQFSRFKKGRGKVKKTIQMGSIGIKLILFLVFGWLCVGLSAAQNRPPIHNFNLNDYKAGIQNWGITYGENRVFVANNEGLLEFDGVKW